jgi:hypothetical protein
MGDPHRPSLLSSRRFLLPPAPPPQPKKTAGEFPLINFFFWLRVFEFICIVRIILAVPFFLACNWFAKKINK